MFSQKYRQRLHFEILIKGKEFLVNLLSIKQTTRYYLADQIFDDQRGDLPIVIVWFKIDDRVSDEVIRHLALHGFLWKGDRYFYFTTKNIGSKTFFCRQFDQTIRNSFSLWDRIASFRNLKSIPEIGMRLGLLMSSSYPGFSYLESSGIEVTVLPDTLGPDLSVLWTEGSGFISSQLVLEHVFPCHVTQGVPIQSPPSTSIEESDSESFALAYQIRFLCSFGLFKGTLIVDPYLKGRKIVLRNSMKKADPPAHRAFDISILSIVNTPPQPSRCDAIHCRRAIPFFVQHFPTDDMIKSHSLVRKCCGCSLPMGNLNRHLVLILNESCGISLKTFQELARLVFVFLSSHLIQGVVPVFSRHLH
jgi:hypothetical protein